MKLDANEIAARIKKEMTSQNLKQKDIYINADISQSAFNRYINAQRLPDAEALLGISKSLNITIEYLLTGSDSGPKLPDQEQELLKLFRQLPDQEKIKVFGYLEAKLPEPDEQLSSKRKDA